MPCRDSECTNCVKAGLSKPMVSTCRTKSSGIRDADCNGDKSPSIEIDVADNKVLRLGAGTDARGTGDATALLELLVDGIGDGERCRDDSDC